MANSSRGRGLIDTSVVIGLERIDPQTLPRELAIATITLAELAAGPHATDDPRERARRQQRLQLAEATFDPLPFDTGCARAYGLVYAEMIRAGRKARGRRALDLLIAATALSSRIPLYSANIDDFAGLEQVIELKAVAERASA
ncbi:MAG: type II toxin-antitoxin system VapC family toxin [Steroidobacteraceae bacterium]